MLGPIGVVLIAVALATTVGAGDGALLYIWPVLWTTFFFGRRGAFAIVALHRRGARARPALAARRQQLPRALGRCDGLGDRRRDRRADARPPQRRAARASSAARLAPTRSRACSTAAASTSARALELARSRREGEWIAIARVRPRLLQADQRRVGPRHRRPRAGPRSGGARRRSARDRRGRALRRRGVRRAAARHRPRRRAGLRRARTRRDRQARTPSSRSCRRARASVGARAGLASRSSCSVPTGRSTRPSARGRDRSALVHAPAAGARRRLTRGRRPTLLR